MKRTRIVKYYKRTNLNEYEGSIIVSINPFNFTIRSTKILENILNDLLITSKKILKKKEKSLIESISSSLKDIEIKRNFNIVFNEFNYVPVSDYYLVLDNEKSNIDIYLKDYKDKIKHSDIKGELTQLIFEYKITFKNE